MADNPVLPADTVVMTPGQRRRWAAWRIVIEGRASLDIGNLESVIAAVDAAEERLLNDGTGG